MSDDRHISSVLVRSDPARMDRVIAAIEAFGIAEIALTDPSGKIVVLLETASQGAIADTMTQIQLLDGVAHAAMVYHQSWDTTEPLPATGEPR